VVALELELLGSHGMASHAYPELLALVESGRLRPDVLVKQRISLDAAATALADVGRKPGITVITSF
jgi:alcohol dehydrogenase